MIHTEQLCLVSEGSFFSLNITDQVKAILEGTAIQQGSVLVFYQHTTGAILLVEHEAGMLVDLQDVLEKITPSAYGYKHHLRGYDSNGAAHVRTAMLNVSLTVPVLDGQLLLGEYQEIIVIDFDPGQKVRTVIVQVTGA
jgi:secondary thiamine-phosphate synthase enzyme